MKQKEIIKHPDSFHLTTISHDGVGKIVSDIECDELYVAVDDSHERYSKIYVLDKDDILNT